MWVSIIVFETDNEWYTRQPMKDLGHFEIGPILMTSGFRAGTVVTKRGKKLGSIRDNGIVIQLHNNTHKAIYNNILPFPSTNLGYLPYYCKSIRLHLIAPPERHKI